MKENHVNEINYLKETFENQKQEIKEHHKNEINIYRELVDAKKNEIFNFKPTNERQRISEELILEYAQLYEDAEENDDDDNDNDNNESIKSKE
ncbi:6885_t:CDS:2 [Cetraspora pellucida]|uniref:6885_t:CDS:1 n=1 Tax=Cetraspora pellucida TaxID=1433469 RepID=A0A9N8VM84_9GLOM|nr:6885_t:CDS:2 [Cetraspora pellucida]